MIFLNGDAPLLAEVRLLEMKELDPRLRAAATNRSIALQRYRYAKSLRVFIRGKHNFPGWQ
jgi:hypothetical protein